MNKLGFPLKESQILDLLSNYDIILPNKIKFYNNIKDRYDKAHYIDDMDKTRIIIERIYPDYLNDFDLVMSRNIGYYYNIFISSKELADSYCEWLFRILFELEGVIDISEYDSYQQRVFGFISERLINVWIEHNKAKVIEFPIRDLTSMNYFKFYLRNIYHKLKQ